MAKRGFPFKLILHVFSFFLFIYSFIYYINAEAKLTITNYLLITLGIIPFIILTISYILEFRRKSVLRKGKYRLDELFKDKGFM
ncbi:MAG: hypothetical protein N4A54_13160 [Peptostreptococcaceae bacterium]|jgi:uncharacterized membrane protein|nr:hypothetical protein [Peptostreptococcaceae bacterium]